MNATQVIVQGTLQPDGKLELAEAPDLPAGPVDVLIRTRSQEIDPADTWWDYLQRAHAEFLAQGNTARTREEIDSDRTRERSRNESRRQSLSDHHAP